MNTRLILISLLVLITVSACKKNKTDVTPPEKPKYLTKITRVSAGNTITTNYSYDDKKRLATITTIDGNKTSTQTFTYSLNNVSVLEIVSKVGVAVSSKVVNDMTYGNGVLLTKKSKLYNGAGQMSLELANGYAYDDKGRLIEAHQEGNVTFFEYDADGNVSKKKFSGVEVNYTYDGKKNMFANLHPELRKIGYQLQFDDFAYKGNLVSAVRTAAPTSTFSYEYDSDGYPISGKNSNNDTYTYVYSTLD